MKLNKDIKDLMFDILREFKFSPDEFKIEEKYDAISIQYYWKHGLLSFGIVRWKKYNYRIYTSSVLDRTLHPAINVNKDDNQMPTDFFKKILPKEIRYHFGEFLEEINHEIRIPSKFDQYFNGKLIESEGLPTDERLNQPPNDEEKNIILEKLDDIRKEIDRGITLNHIYAEMIYSDIELLKYTIEKYDIPLKFTINSIKWTILDWFWNNLIPKELAQAITKGFIDIIKENFIGLQ